MDREVNACHAVPSEIVALPKGLRVEFLAPSYFILAEIPPSSRLLRVGV